MSMKEPTFEKAFYDYMDELFEVPMEGRSGYIKYLTYRKQYYDKVIKPAIQENINNILGSTEPDMREDIFKMLLDFFKENLTNEHVLTLVKPKIDETHVQNNDVTLVWPTKDYYYVKTDKLYKSIDITINNYHFFFDVSDYEYSKSGEKRYIIYRFNKIDENGKIVIKVLSTENVNNKTNIDNLHGEIINAGIDINIDVVKKAIRKFERSGKMADFFICKNANEILKRRLKKFILENIQIEDTEDNT